MKVQSEGFRLRILGGYAIARALPLPFNRRHFRHRYGTDLLVERALRSVPREVVSQFGPIIGGAVQVLVDPGVLERGEDRELEILAQEAQHVLLAEEPVVEAELRILQAVCLGPRHGIDERNHVGDVAGLKLERNGQTGIKRVESDDLVDVQAVAVFVEALPRVRFQAVAVDGMRG